MTRIIAETGTSYYAILELGADDLYHVVGHAANLGLAKQIASPEHPVNAPVALEEPAPKRRPGRPRKAVE